MVRRLGVAPQGVWQMVCMMKRREGVMPELFRLTEQSVVRTEIWTDDLIQIP